MDEMIVSLFTTSTTKYDICRSKHHQTIITRFARLVPPPKSSSPTTTTSTSTWCSTHNPLQRLRRNQYHHIYNHKSKSNYYNCTNCLLLLLFVFIFVTTVQVTESFRVGTRVTLSLLTSPAITPTSTTSSFMNRSFYRNNNNSIIRRISTIQLNNPIYNFHRTTSCRNMSTKTQQPHHRPPNHVCIVGGGIIGTATAYYLSTVYGISCTIVDRTGTIAPAASGKAGGFLAYDWNDGTPTEALTHRSFRLHEELANQFTPESIQYRKLSCVAMNIASSSRQPIEKSSSRKLQNIEWAATDTVQNVRTLGTETTIAQVHPKLLCERLWYETKQCIPSCQLVKGNVVETLYSATKSDRPDDHTNTNESSITMNSFVCGVQLDDGTRIDADAVLYACGPWNVFHSKTTGDLQTSMYGVKYHSLIVPTPRIYTQCVFFQGHGDPEVYVRPDQTAYCTGYPEPARIVTETPGEEAIDDPKIEAIYNAIQQVTHATTTITAATTAVSTDNGNNDDNNIRNETPGLLLENKNVLIKQACYLPSTDDGIPIMGQLFTPPYVPHPLENGSNSGLYIATGHSCWGILLGPGTGECMASFIATGQSTPYVPLQAFDPYRFIV